MLATVGAIKPQPFCTIEISPFFAGCLKGEMLKTQIVERLKKFNFSFPLFSMVKLRASPF
jgi:hypothetical protein